MVVVWSWLLVISVWYFVMRRRLWWFGDDVWWCLVDVSRSGIEVAGLKLFVLTFGIVLNGSSFNVDDLSSVFMRWHPLWWFGIDVLNFGIDGFGLVLLVGDLGLILCNAAASLVIRRRCLVMWCWCFLIGDWSCWSEIVFLTFGIVLNDGFNFDDLILFFMICLGLLRDPSGKG